MKKAILFMSLIICFAVHSKAQKPLEKPNRNYFALDVMPLYYDFFDYRKQIRLGVDYAHSFKTHWFAALALDCGLYDDYSFTKYYDFFNQSSGYHYVKQDVRITGFHLLPSGNYFFWQSKSKPRQGMYAGAMLDANFYRKKLDIFNSQTLENSSDVITQFKMGAGLSLGGRCYMGHHFFAEIQTSFFAKLFLTTSDENVNVVKSVNAQWNSTNNNFWWLSNLKLGYAF